MLTLIDSQTKTPNDRSWYEAALLWRFPEDLLRHVRAPPARRRTPINSSSEYCI